MAKALEWVWTLPQGQRVSARYDPSTKVESVFLEKRLVSRSTPESRKEMHIIPLTGGGAYRGATEAQVAFDVFGSSASCVLTADGQVIEPGRKPEIAKKIAVSGVGFGFFYLLTRVIVTVGLHRPHHVSSPVSSPVAAPVVRPAVRGFQLVPITDVPINSGDYAAIQPAVDRCWAAGVQGRVVIEVRLSKDGRVESSKVLGYGSFPIEVQNCIARAIGTGRFEDALSLVLRIPVESIP